jgi:Mg2+ and Co2+ transporter CorA
MTRSTSMSDAYFKKFGQSLIGGSNDAMHMKRPCTIFVHDYGFDSQTGQVVYQLNGRNLTDDEIVIAIPYQTVEEVKAGLPLLDREKPSWCTVRWIDVDDGINGDIIQYLTGLVGCDRQFIFDNIVDVRQSAMALLLDTKENTDQDIINFLMVTRSPSLSEDDVSSFVSQSNDQSNIKGFLRSEQISFLLHISTEGKYAQGGAPGILMTLQEGLTGDDFGEVRRQLRERKGVITRHGVAHLLQALVKTSIESASDIEKFVDASLSTFRDRLSDRKELKNPINDKLLKKIQSECEAMHRILLPAMQALDFMCHNLFPREVLGNNVIAYHNLNVQTRRLDSNILEQQIFAKQLLSAIDDFQKEEGEQRSARVERSSFIMGLVLAMFSPLSFISGMYGMNFITPNGEPGLPELTWWPDENGSGISGYAYFWILCGCCIFSTIVLYIVAGLIPNPFAGVYDYIIERNLPQEELEDVKYLMNGEKPKRVSKLFENPMIEKKSSKN